MCRKSKSCVVFCVRKAQRVMNKVLTIVDVFRLLNFWTGHLSANPRKTWHQNHIVLLDCYWRAFDSASHPTLAEVHSKLPKYQSCAAEKRPLFCQNQMNCIVSNKASCLYWKIILFSLYICFTQVQKDAVFLITDLTHEDLKRIRWRHGGGFWVESMIYSPSWGGNGMLPYFFILFF